MVSYRPLTRMPVKRVRVMFQLKQALCTGSPWFDLIGHLVIGSVICEQKHFRNISSQTQPEHNFLDDKGSMNEMVETIPMGNH